MMMMMIPKYIKTTFCCIELLGVGFTLFHSTTSALFIEDHLSIQSQRINDDRV